MTIKNPEKILKKAAKMEAQNDATKQSRKTKKELWKTQSLEDSLYNVDENGKKIPRDSDIDQGSYSNLNYSLKQYDIGDCFLLANLMGLAKKRSNFIQSELIKVKNKHEVTVGLYETKTPPEIKIKENSITLTYEPVSSKSFYTVSKAEALAWKTCHLALWPVVIEIAYAKHLKSMLIKNKDQIEKSMRTSMRPLIEQQVKQYYIQTLGRDPNDSEFEETVEKAITEALKNLLDQNSDLRTMFKDGGVPSAALTHLTGAKSKQKIFADANMDITKLIPDLDKKIKQEYNQKFKGTNTSSIKAFQGKYSPEALKIYDKIQKKLNSGKIITVGFKGGNPSVATSMLFNTGLPKTDNNKIAFTTIQLAKSLKADPLKTIDALTLKDSLKKETYEKWLKDHELNLADLGTPKVTDEMQKNLF